MRKFCALSVLLSLLLIGDSAWAAPAAERPFTPVQAGPVPSAPAVALWAPDRVLVQLTPAGQQSAAMPSAGEKAAGARTGLASLDQAMNETAVTGLRVAFPLVANQTLAQAVGAERWYIFDLAAGADVPAVAQRLAADANVSYALPDLRAFPAIAPNDALYPNNWGHNNTGQLPDLDWGGTYDHTSATTVGIPGFDANAQAAWNGAQGYGDSNVIIAILDSGVDAGHPDLLQVTGFDFGDNDADPTDDSTDPGHGTACAGIAAATADNNLGAAGVAGGCSIMPLKVADSAGAMYFSAIIDAVYYAADNGADIISMSLGSTGTVYEPMDAAVTYAYSQGVTLLAATGNENASQIGYPAYNPLVIGVGAASPCDGRKRSATNPNFLNSGVDPDPNDYTCDGERWWGSNYGSAVKDHQGAVDILAPTILPTTDIQGSGGYAAGDYSNFFNGTSCSTPYAAGVCALIKSANPTFTPLEVRTQLTATAQDVVNVESTVGWDRYSGYGLVDAAAAVGTVVPPPVQATFTAADTVGCAPFTVDFTDTSVGSPTSWLWHFGDGSFSSLQHPSYTYTAPGVYDVDLSITAPEGSDMVTKIGYIVVTGPPTAAFTSSATYITVGDSVDFTDSSTGDPTAWSWDFGDGGTAVAQNPSHVFDTVGGYSIKLVAANACGVDSLTQNFLILVAPPAAPSAGFSFAPGSGCAPLDVGFSDESTGVVDTWSWDFGDGAIDSTASPSHLYLSPGTFDVTLIVANAGGADTLTVAGAVTAAAPPVTAFAVSDSVIVPGGSVTFSDLTTGAPTTWDWDFGDGTTATAQNPVHQYADAGLYSVVLITGNTCGSDTLSVPDRIVVAEPAGPVAAFAPDPATGCAPLTVDFTDASLNNVSGWYWDFGDGGLDTLQSPVHTYDSPGSYAVRLIVSGIGGVDTLTVADAVVVQAPVSAAFSVSDTLAAPPLAVTFTNGSTGDATFWSWDFGDAATDTVANPVHTYLVDGVYDVTLIVGNSCSADTLTMSAAVAVNSLSAVGGALPARFGLGRNYPNPFNPSTTIVYSLARPGHALLEVYDVSGRRVAILVDGDQSAGTHEMTWRPTEIASGVYFARLAGNGKVATRRITLLK